MGETCKLLIHKLAITITMYYDGTSERTQAFSHSYKMCGYTLQQNMGPITSTFHSFCNEFHENLLQ